MSINKGLLFFLNNLNSPDFEKKQKNCQISTLGTPVGSHGIEGFWNNFTIRSALIVNIVSKNCHSATLGEKKKRNKNLYFYFLLFYFLFNASCGARETH